MSPTRVAWVCLVGLALCISAVSGHAAEEEAPAPAAPTAPHAAPQAASAAVSVAEIAAQGATATEFLRTLTSQFAPSAEIETIRRALPEASRVDVIFSGMTMTPQRNTQLAFAGPHFGSGKSVLIKQAKMTL